MKSSKAYRAGQHVHNFFAMIGTSIYAGVSTVGATARDFAKGVKNGGESEESPQPKSRSRKEAAA